MITLYLILGFLVAVVGALPLGAVNLAVINTSIKENNRKASQITLAAGIGEVMLAILALQYSMQLSIFFKEHIWIQIAFTLVFFLIGLYFLFLSQKATISNTIYKTSRKHSKFITGFSLAVLNPPVIIYWILVISMINTYFFELTLHNSITSLVLFFLGIYLGKTGILYLYGKLGNKITRKQEGSKTKLYKMTGIALIVIAMLQGIRFVII